MTSLCGVIYRVIFVDSTLKSLILFLLIGVVLSLRRRASAAEHHTLWKFGLLSLLLLPLLSSLFPVQKLPILPGALASPFERVRQVPPLKHAGPSRIPIGATLASLSAQDSLSSRPVAQYLTPSPAASSPFPLGADSYRNTTPAYTAVPAAPREWRRATITSLCILWLSGCVLLLSMLYFDSIKLARLKRRANPFRNESITILAQGLAKELGMTRSFALYSAPNIMPMTWGWLRPVVLLPSGIETWPAGRIRMVLLHELAHIRRQDWLTQRLARFVCILYWFHPIAWLALRSLRRESEHACDDLVLSTGIGAPEYAQQLLEVIRMMKHLRPLSRATVMMAQSTHFQSRLQAILDPNRKRGGSGRPGLLLLLCLAGLIPLSITRVTAQQENASASLGRQESAPAEQATEETPSARRKTPSKHSEQGSDLAALIVELQDQTAALETLSAELKRSATASNLPPDVQRTMARQQEQVQSQIDTLRTLLKKLKSQQAAIAKQSVALQKSLQRMAQADQQRAEMNAEAALAEQKLRAEIDAQATQAEQEEATLKRKAQKLRSEAQNRSEHPEADTEEFSDLIQNQQAKRDEEQAAVAGAVAQLTAQQANILTAEAKLKRLQQLFQNGFVGPEELDAAQAQLAKAKADLLTAQAQLQLLRANTDSEKRSVQQDLMVARLKALQSELNSKMNLLKQVQQRYAAGGATQQEVSKQQIELEQVKGQILVAETQLKLLQAKTDGERRSLQRDVIVANLQTLESELNTRMEMLKIAQQRFAAGLTNHEEVDEQQAELEALKAKLAVLEAELAAQKAGTSATEKPHTNP